MFPFHRSAVSPFVYVFINKNLSQKFLKLIKMEPRVKKVCRTCQQRADVLTSVFQSKDIYDGTHVVADLITIIIPEILIEKSDHESKEICSKCLEIIVSAYRLRLKSRQSDKQMRNEVKMKNKIPPSWTNPQSRQCRLCLSKANTLEKIFKSRQDYLLADAIRSVCKVQLSNADSLSQDICYKCRITVNEAFDLVRANFDAPVFDDDDTAEIKKEDQDDDVISISDDSSSDVGTGKVAEDVAEMSDASLLSEGISVDSDDDEKVAPTTSRKRKLSSDDESAFDDPDKINYGTRSLPFICKVVPCGMRFADGTTFRTHLKSHNLTMYDNKKPQPRSVPQPGPSKIQKKSTPIAAEDLKRKPTRKLVTVAMRKPTIANKNETAANSYTCEFCGLQLENLSEKSIHVNYYHGLKKTVKVDKKTIKDDQKTININDLYRCGICQKTASNRRELAYHTNKHTNTSKFWLGCSLCFELFSNIGSMNHHLLSTHNVQQFSIKYSCAHCSFLTGNKRKLQSHIFRDHFNITDKPFKCEVCELACQNHYTFLRHQHFSHGITSPGYYFCKSCEFLTTKTREMIRHGPNCSANQGDVLCTKCGLCCKTQSELELHDLLHSDLVEKVKDDEEIKAFCAICSFRSLCEADVTQHLEEHRERMSKEPVNCTRCDEMIQNYDHLLLHAKKHTARKDYRCLRCRRLFFNDRKFLIHIKRHMVPQTVYNCSQCPKEFKSTFGLKHHVDTIHSSTGKLLCPVCGVT